jgi:hypothetical protein
MIEYAPPTTECVDYDTAWLYCVTLAHDNKYDWRMPTHKEYETSPFILGWFVDRPQTENLWTCQPVRDC